MARSSRRTANAILTKGWRHKASPPVPPPRRYEVARDSRAEEGTRRGRSHRSRANRYGNRVRSSGARSARGSDTRSLPALPTAVRREQWQNELGMGRASSSPGQCDAATKRELSRALRTRRSTDSIKIARQPLYYVATRDVSAANSRRTRRAARSTCGRFSRLILGDSSLRIATKSCKTIALPPPLPGRRTSARRYDLVGFQELACCSLRGAVQ